MLRAIQCDDIGGIEIIALDKGPGIADVAASLRDGYSTAGTMGGGLGALSRLSDTFEIYTQPGKRHGRAHRPLGPPASRHLATDRVRWCLRAEARRAGERRRLVRRSCGATRRSCW